MNLVALCSTTAFCVNCFLNTYLQAMLLLSVYGDHINQVTDGIAANSNSNGSSSAHYHAHSHHHHPIGSSYKMPGGGGGGNSSEFRGKLGDAEEFVRIMLQVPAPSSSAAAMIRSSFSVPTAAMLGNSANEHLQYSFIAANGNGATGGGGERERGSFCSTGKRSFCANASPLVRRLFNEENPATSTSHRSNPHSMNGGVYSPGGGAGGGAPSGPAPQLLRSPPPGYKPDFDA